MTSIPMYWGEFGVCVCVCVVRVCVCVCGVGEGFGKGSMNGVIALHALSHVAMVVSICQHGNNYTCHCLESQQEGSMCGFTRKMIS